MLRALRVIPVVGALALGVFGGTGCERGEEAGATAPPHNLLLITIDTLRPDRLGFGGHVRDTSPVMDRLAAEGRWFETAYSQSGWTLPSIATVLTGRHPSEHGAIDERRRIRAELPTLAALLRARGYATAAFVSHVMLGTEHGFAEGFDLFDDSVLDVGHPHFVSTARDLTDLAIGALGEMPEPYFLWVHYFDPHFNYLPRDARFGLVDREDRYDGEIFYTDEQIGRLLDFVKQSAGGEGTVVVLTADHGEEFGEHGSKLHFSLHEEVVRIPLVFSGPGITPGADDFVAQQIDVLPTVLAALGVEAPPELPGRDLLAADRAERLIYLERIDPVPFVQRVLISGDTKLYRVAVDGAYEGDLARLKRKTGLSPGTRVYDLAADPGEQHDRFDPDDLEVRALLETLAEFEASEPAPDLPAPVDEALRRRLRSLGYLR